MANYQNTYDFAIVTVGQIRVNRIVEAQKGDSVVRPYEVEGKLSRYDFS
jgi:hypothetical protein